MGMSLAAQVWAYLTAHARRGDVHHHKEQKMTKQNQQPQQNEQQQANARRGKNPDQQGGRNPPGQSGDFQKSQGQPGARQSDQGGSRESAPRNSEKPVGSQRGQTAHRQGAGTTGNESPEMSEDNQSDQASERLRRGALDAQYGTDSSSKTAEQNTRSAGTQSPTGSDRDTMGGARTKSR
jgi:hypothetical protein